MALGKGLKDWLIQRFTAVFLGGYTIYLLIYLINNPGLSFQDWSHCFSSPLAQIATFIALVCVSLHAWIGIWTVATDYIKPAMLRWAFLGVVMTFLMGYFAWGIRILWG